MHKYRFIILILFFSSIISNACGNNSNNINQHRKKKFVQIESTNSKSELNQNSNSINHSLINHINESDLQVLITANSILIKTSYDKSQDLVYKYIFNNTKLGNGNFTGNSVYLVPKNFNLKNNITPYLVHYIDDSISALGTEQYWFILGQHGYLIPVVTVNNNKFKIGEIVADNKGSKFKIIDVQDKKLYLAPEVSKNNGLVKRSWRNGDSFSTLKTSNNEIVKVNKVSNYQLKPMMKKQFQRILIDNKEVKNQGTYSGTYVKLIDHFYCINPENARFNGINNMDGNKLLEIEQSYYFRGKSIFSKSKINVLDDLPFTKYHGIQPVGLKKIQNTEVYLMAPKVKPKASKGGAKAVDWNYPTNVTTLSNNKYSQYLYSVTKNDLINETDIPDRVIQFLKKTNNNSYVIGFAAGLDLINGLTNKQNRIKYTDEAFSISGSLSNKTYFRVLTANKFKNHLLPKGFQGQFNGYFSYYKPKPDLQAYTVNDEGVSYIYIHMQKKSEKETIILDSFLNGKSCSIIEKEGINLLSSKVEQGSIIVKSESNKSNYIVLMVK